MAPENSYRQFHDGLQAVLQQWIQMAEWAVDRVEPGKETDPDRAKLLTLIQNAKLLLSADRPN